MRTKLPLSLLERAFNMGKLCRVKIVFVHWFQTTQKYPIFICSWIYDNLIASCKYGCGYGQANCYIWILRVIIYIVSGKWLLLDCSLFILNEGKKQIVQHVDPDCDVIES